MALTPEEIEQLIDEIKKTPGMCGIFEVELYDNVTEKRIYMQNGVKLYAPPVPGVYIYTDRVEDDGDRYHPHRHYYRTTWIVERVGLPSDSSGNPENIMAFVSKVREDEV